MNNCTTEIVTDVCIIMVRKCCRNSIIVPVEYTANMQEDRYISITQGVFAGNVISLRRGHVFAIQDNILTEMANEAGMQGKLHGYIQYTDK